MNWEVNRPDVVVEVRAAFDAYEKALVDGDLEVMTASFSSGEEVVRFGIGDRQHGAAEIAAWRATQAPLPPTRTLTDTVVTTYGGDMAVVSTGFSYPERHLVGRQQQTWVRFLDGWKVVAAHVSEIPAGG
jgi:hypothetical protein